MVHRGGRQHFPVQIISAHPDRVTVARADYGFVSHDAERRSLAVPVGERVRPCTLD